MKYTLRLLIIIAFSLFTSKTAQSQFITVTSPNGNEAFANDSSITITWKGVPPSEICTIEYSIDDGVTWTFITKQATGLQYVWSPLPDIRSSNCRIRIQSTNPPLDITPQIQWQKTFGGSNIDGATFAQETFDGGYIVSGTALSSNGDIGVAKGAADCWILKLDALGNTEWKKSYGGSDDEYAYWLQQTRDSGYVFTGFTMSSNGDIKGQGYGGRDIWTVKLNKAGDIEWETTIGSVGNDLGLSVEETSDGGFIVCGTVGSFGKEINGYNGGTDGWLIKYSMDGTIEWHKVFGGSGLDGFRRVREAVDGSGFVITGSNASTDYALTNKGAEDIWILKVDQLGNIMWQHSYGGSDSDNAYDLDIVDGNGYCIIGSTRSSDGDLQYPSRGMLDNVLLKVTENGILEWAYKLGGTKDDVGFSINHIHTNQFVIAATIHSDDGDIRDFNGFQDYWVSKINSNGNIIWQLSVGGTNADDIATIRPTSDGGYILAGNSYSNDGDVTDHNGAVDYWVVKLTPEVSRDSFKDVSDNTFSIGNSNNSKKKLTLGIGSHSAEVGDTISISLVVQGDFASLLSKDESITVDLTFNPSLLYPLDYQVQHINNTTATITIDNLPITKNSQQDTLVNIDFIVGLGNAPSADLILSNAKLDGNNTINIALAQGTFTLLDLCEEGGTRLIAPNVQPGALQIAPNPAKEALNISFNVVEQGSMELALYNTLGKKVQVLFAENIDNNYGKRNILVNIPKITEGTYLLRLQTPSFIETQPIIIQR
jgi:hypothetical protein